MTFQPWSDFSFPNKRGSYNFDVNGDTNGGRGNRILIKVFDGVSFPVHHGKSLPKPLIVPYKTIRQDDGSHPLDGVLR